MWAKLKRFFANRWVLAIIGLAIVALLIWFVGDAIAFYDPGSAEIKPDLLPVINRIAQAINQVPGVVTVSGHTDNQPTKRSLRFPSNYELSLERARGVATLLGQTVQNHTIKAEGLADSKPLAPNNTPDGRARNRRVEITLRTGA